MKVRTPSTTAPGFRFEHDVAGAAGIVVEVDGEQFSITEGPVQGTLVVTSSGRPLVLRPIRPNVVSVALNGGDELAECDGCGKLSATVRTRRSGLVETDQCDRCTSGDAVLGKRKRAFVTCDECEGQGYGPAPTYEPCATCEGSGEVPATESAAAGRWRCDECGTSPWVGWAASPGGPRKAQCVSCGHVQALPESER